MNAVIFPTLMYKQVIGPALTQGSHKIVYGRSEGHRGHLWPHYTESYFRRCWEEQPSWFVCPYSRAVYTLKNMLPPLKNTVFSSILCEFHTMGCFPWIVSEGCFRDVPPQKKSIQAIAINIGCPPKPDSKTIENSLFGAVENWGFKRNLLFFNSSHPPFTNIISICLFLEALPRSSTEQHLFGSCY